MINTKMESYNKIISMSLFLTILLGLTALLITKSWMAVYSILLGGVLAIGGFIWIIGTSNSLLYHPNATKIAFIHFMIRFMVYGFIFYFGIVVGLNVVLMLIGFICLNISIKINTLLEKR